MMRKEMTLMTSKQFRERFMTDFPAKVICLALTLLIYWLYNFSQIDKKTLTVPVQVIENGAVTAETDVNHVRAVKVFVKTRQEYLSGIKEDDFNVYVDISAVGKEGTFDFPVIIEPSNSLLLMDSLEVRSVPESIKLSVEKKYFRYVDVEPSLAGTQARGYRVSAVTVEPPFVRVSGAKSVVDQVSSILTDAVDISGISRPAEMTVHLVNENSLLKVEDTPVTVKVFLEQVQSTRDFTNLKVTASGLKSSLELVSISGNVDISVSGSTLSLEKISDSQILAIVDCSSIGSPGTYDLPVVLSLPSWVSLVSQSRASVQVNVREIPVVLPSEPLVPAEESPVEENVEMPEVQ